MDRAFVERYGPWALVAGASQGLGLAFARAAAARGLHLVLVARRAEPLAAAAALLQRDHGVETRCLALDLGAEGAAEQLVRATEDLDLGLVIYNAAWAPAGLFLEQPLMTHLTALRVNCLTPVELCHRLGSRLVARRRGGLILVSSLSGLAGSPYLAVYAATKAFLWWLGEALAEEMRPHGVDVLVSIPGATATPGYLARSPRTLGGPRPRLLAPEAVAAEAFFALGRTPLHVPGIGNRLAAALLQRFLPRQWAVRLLGRAGRAVAG